MKRRLFLMIILAAVTLSGMAQHIGEAFYIYRNDGGFNAFFRDEVISMEYSYEDAEGNTYDEVVTQIINTADSVYKIPLAAIDSVGFVTPETQYKPGVKVIEGDLRKYVLSSDELQIAFSAKTPSNLLPQIGDKLVTLEQSDTFPIGFMGEVISVTTTADGNYMVDCEAVTMTDIFKCYYGVINSTNSDSRLRFPQRRAVHGPGQVTITPSPFRFSLTDDWKLAIDSAEDDFAFTFQPNFLFEFAPTFQVSAFLILPDHEDNELNISLSCIADFHFMGHIGATGGLEWSHDWGWKDPATHLPRLSWPIPDCPLVRFYIEPGAFIRASSKISAQSELTQDYRLVFHYDVSSRYGQSMKPTLTPRALGLSADGEITMDGSIALGGYAEMGFLIADKDFAHICFRGELGFEGESKAVLLKAERSTAMETTEVYDRLHDTALNFNWFYGTSIEGKIWPFSVSCDLPLARKEPIARLGHVPSFSDVKLEAISIGTVKAEASINIDGSFSRLIRPVRVGFALHNENGDIVDTYFDEEDYQSGRRYISHIFTDIEEGEKYTVYPVVDYNGLVMLAKPSAKVDTPEYPVKITEFKQTGSEHKMDAFTHDGKTYSYKYDCTVTVELINSLGVEDWGYVYKDPDGKTAHISLKSFGSPYTDSRYVYYRNESPSTITLYEYVKFTGDNEYYYGNPKDYPVQINETICPDANHPHWIDLGLPSGTQWRCCNEGANTPEGYGYYYTFELATSAPSRDQINEFLTNTTSAWTTLNGVDGRKYTGSNGASIFLPTVPPEDGVGTGGFYWSSTPSDVNKACYFNSYLGMVGSWLRSSKYSVRPVR